MKLVKRLFVFTFFSLLFAAFGAKVVQAYKLTLKPKFECGEGKVLVKGNCISVDVAY